jgi:molybdate transport system ATP-binding protein
MLELDIQKELSHFQLALRFRLEQEIVVLSGPSGSGKTTILNCIAGLSAPDSGYIKLNGSAFFENGRALPPQKRNIGYLFQDYALFPHMTVENNILYGVKTKKRKPLPSLVQQLLEVLGIGHLLGKYPHQISGGEKQRVALARSLATEPSLLLLDEPLSALDQETRTDCQNELLRLHQLWKIPFIIVTHDLHEAQKLGDDIFMIEKGKIVHAQKATIVY